MSASISHQSPYILNLLYTNSEDLQPICSNVFVNHLNKSYGETTVNSTYKWLLNPSKKFEGTEDFIERTTNSLINNHLVSVADQKYILNHIQQVAAGRVRLS